MEGLTINEAARTTGWSARMLRYVEQTGLVSPARSASGYRLYGPAQLQRLRTLKELLARFDVGLSDVAFAARMADSPELRDVGAGVARSRGAPARGRRSRGLAPIRAGKAPEDCWRSPDGDRPMTPTVEDI